MAPVSDQNKFATDDASVVQIEDSAGVNVLTITAAGAAKVDGSAVTQPVSAASLPLPTGASTSANQTTLGSQTTKVNDGTNTAAVKAASTAAVATDPALVVAVSPNNTVGATQSGTWTVQQGSTPTAVANAWPVKITDGTNTTAVKAASTAAVATDSSQVVALSPNSPIPTGSNLIGKVDTRELPDSTSTYAPSNATSTALEASRVIKASAGVLYSLNGYSSKTTQQFILIHNATSLPADGAVPVMVITVPARSNFSIDTGKFGRFFSSGIVITNSSTAATKTIGSADCWFDVQFS